MGYEWGPPLWRVLHTIAEHLGRQPVPSLSVDERRACLNFLHSIESVLPCEKCKKHYKAWRQKNPPHVFGQGAEFRDAVRTWLWALHSEINEENGVTTEPALIEMPSLYGKYNKVEFAADVRLVYSIFEKGIILRTVHPIGLAVFKSSFGILRKLISL
jgi:hypothetical protein